MASTASRIAVPADPLSKRDVITSPPSCIFYPIRSLSLNVVCRKRNDSNINKIGAFPEESKSHGVYYELTFDPATFQPASTIQTSKHQTKISIEQSYKNTDCCVHASTGPSLEKNVESTMSTFGEDLTFPQLTLIPKTLSDELYCCIKDEKIYVEKKEESASPQTKELPFPSKLPDRLPDDGKCQKPPKIPPSDEENDDVAIRYKRMGLRNLCLLCCCGFCQPKKTINMLVFWPPTPSTYRLQMLQADNSLVEFSPQRNKPKQSRKRKTRKVTSSNALSPPQVAADRVFFVSRLPYPIYSLHIEPYLVESASGGKVACVYVRCCCFGEARRVILHSHVNASDVGLELIHLQYSRLSGVLRQSGYDVLLYDYSGYGMSEGQPSEENIYLDAQTAFKSLTERFPVERIVLYGASIGSAPSVHLALLHAQVGGLILHSSIASAARVAFKCCDRPAGCLDAFTNYKKIARVETPVLFIHGTQDRVASFAQAFEMHASCGSCVQPLWVDGGGHNNLEMHDQFYTRLANFLTLEVRPI